MPATPTEKRWTLSVVAFFSAVLGSSLAATALTTVLGKLVFDITGSELDLGMLGLAEFAPAAFLVLLSGTLADRHDRRNRRTALHRCETQHRAPNIGRLSRKTGHRTEGDKQSHKAFQNSH